MKKIEDYLPFYLGCKYISTLKGMEYGTIAGFSVSECCDFVDLCFIDENGDELTIPTNCFDEVKPILRHISSMTQEERVELWNMIFWYKFPDNGQVRRVDTRTTASDPRWILSAGVERLGIEDNGTAWANSDLSHHKHNQHEVTRWFLMKQFDVFELIKDGLAIDATTFQKEVQP